jgi:hypothetical protein
LNEDLEKLLKKEEECNIEMIPVRQRHLIPFR